MKAPKEQKRYCVYCKKHTLQSIDLAKRRARKEDTKSQRRFKRKLAGYGSFPKENPKGREKPTRKVDLRYKCKECGKQSVIGTGFRVKKYELQKS